MSVRARTPTPTHSPSEKAERLTSSRNLRKCLSIHQLTTKLTEQTSVAAHNRINPRMSLNRQQQEDNKQQKQETLRAERNLISRLTTLYYFKCLVFDKIYETHKKTGKQGQYFPIHRKKTNRYKSLVRKPNVELIRQRL